MIAVMPDIHACGAAGNSWYLLVLLNKFCGVNLKRFYVLQ